MELEQQRPRRRRALRQRRVPRRELRRRRARALRADRLRALPPLEQLAAALARAHRRQRRRRRVRSEADARATATPAGFRCAEQRSHMTEPQRRQWWRRSSCVKPRAHTEHDLTWPSASHATTCFGSTACANRPYASATRCVRSRCSELCRARRSLNADVGSRAVTAPATVFSTSAVCASDDTGLLGLLRGAEAALAHALRLARRVVLRRRVEPQPVRRVLAAEDAPAHAAVVAPHAREAIGRRPCRSQRAPQWVVLESETQCFLSGLEERIARSCSPAPPSCAAATSSALVRREEEERVCDARDRHDLDRGRKSQRICASPPPPPPWASSRTHCP